MTIGKKINILFDISILGYGKKAGIYRVIENLINRINQNKKYNLFFCTSTSNYRLCKKYLKSQQQFDKEQFLYPCFPKALSVFFKSIFIVSNQFRHMFDFIYKRIIRFSSILHMANIIKNIVDSVPRLFLKLYKHSERNRIIPNNDLKRIDVFLSPYLYFPNQILENSGIKRFIIIHDIIPVLYPHYFDFVDEHPLKITVDKLNLQDNIVCVSESTKKDLLSYRKDLVGSNIIVSLLAASDEIRQVKDKNEINTVKMKYNIPFDEDYILSVGTIEPRKNIDRIIKNFVNLSKSGKIKNINLVLIGRKGWKYDSIFEEFNKEPSHKNKIIFTGYVEDKDMSAIMSGALFFIYISLYEGFGLPPLEAMKCGIPVIASKNSSLPEVVEDSAITVDAENDEEIQQAIFELYLNRDLRDQLARKSLKQAEKFSWEKTTAKIMHFVEEVINKNRE